MAGERVFLAVLETPVLNLLLPETKGQAASTSARMSVAKR